MRRHVRRAVLSLAFSLLAAFALSGPANGASPARLLAKYQPVTVFDPLESFLPTSVESFVEDTDLELLTGPNTWTLVNPAPQADVLPGPGTGIWRLNHDGCTPTAGLAAVACYVAAGGDGENVVYGRVVRIGDRIVLQYWYFYDDNFYSYAYPPSDFIWQAHEGDWEVVNVVLAEEEEEGEVELEARFVGYSQHCLGERRRWSKTPRWRGSHPVVHVAVGSHANYFSPGTHPIHTTCLPTQAIALLQQAGLPLPLDYAGSGSAAGPARFGGEVTSVVRVQEQSPSWLLFPGFWGELEFLHAPPPVGTVPIGLSPVGPAYHAVWQAPLATLAAWPRG